MAAFMSKLVVECISDVDATGRGFWMVREPFQYFSDILGAMITVEAGFITDFASVPRVPFIYDLLGDTAHKPAVIHDWLYHHHEVCDEQKANDIFREACINDGVPEWRLFSLWVGVVLGGKTGWDEDGKGNGHSIVNGQIV
jgi:hypothetical protein